MTELDEINVSGKTYKPGDRIDLYKNDIGFVIVRIVELVWRHEKRWHLTVKREHGTEEYVYNVGGWVGHQPQWYKKEKPGG